MATAGFYEVQLLQLAVICVISLSIDKYVAGKNAKYGKESADDRLESGKSGSASALAALTRRYLVVYGIVMGELFVQLKAIVAETNLQARTGCKGLMCTLCTGNSMAFRREW